MMNMKFYKTEEFLKDILSHVKFFFDREEIRLELKDHMIEKIENYMELGYDVEEAEEFTIKDMGDPEIIGVELNKEHNPIIGWIWRITQKIVGFFIIINILIAVPIILMTIFNTNYINRIPKDNIVYRINLNEKRQVDNRVIKFTNIIYEKDGNLNIFYRDYDKSFHMGGWNFGNIGIIRDDLGNEYPGYSGSGGGRVFSRWINTIKDFPEEANMLIIDYDQYNRKYKVEIPLKQGEINE